MELQKIGQYNIVTNNNIDLIYFKTNLIGILDTKNNILYTLDTRRVILSGQYNHLKDMIKEVSAEEFKIIYNKICIL